MRKLRALLRNKSVVKKSLFVAYTIFIVWYALLKREPRGTERVFKPELFWAIRAWIVNPTVESKKEAVQYLMNILFFIPYGLLFPWKDNWKRVFVTALILSVFIELSQFIFNLGWCEVDDVISNTLGAMIGWGAIRQISRKVNIAPH
jgi:glycopeptide antibiotics resistance protein